MYRNKIAVITGSTSGLGEATALKLAKEGAKGLVITGRNAQRGEKVRREVSALGAKAIFVPADLADPEACKMLIGKADEHFGCIHGLVNSAAYTDRATIEDAPLEELEKHWQVNLRAPFLLIQETVKIMQREKSAGSIVNIGSVAGHCGEPFLAPYSTSKGGLVTLTKNVAHSQRFHRIRCNAVLPGWMDTPAEHDIQRRFHDAPEDWLEKAEAKKPFGKLIKPDEVAHLIALLLSDQGGVMTGAIIDYDQNIIGKIG